MAKYNWRRHITVNEGIKIFHYGRRLGKTTALARLVEENPRGIMIVPNRAMKRYIAESHPRIRNRIYVTEELVGWDMSRTNHMGCREAFKQRDYYIDEVDMIDKAFIISAYHDGCLKAFSFTAITEDYEARLGEIPSYKQIVQKIIDKNRKTYYHKFHDENSQLYRRITRFSTTARAELMPGIM